jgi:hypothetical protein
MRTFFYIDNEKVFPYISASIPFSLVLPIKCVILLVPSVFWPRVPNGVLLAGLIKIHPVDRLLMLEHSVSDVVRSFNWKTYDS